MKKIKNANKVKSKVKYQTEEQQEITRFLIIVAIIIVCVVGVYFFTRTYVTKDEKKKEETETKTPATINYDVTIIGALLNRPYDEYYALIYDSTSVSANKYQGIYSTYIMKQDQGKLYYIDLNNVLNKPYYSEEETNPEAKTIDELKLGECTLIKVKKQKIVKYIEDFDEMKKELKIED